MAGTNYINVCTLMCSIILVSHVNALPFGSDPFGDGFGSNSGSSHNRMHDPFGSSNNDFGSKFPSDPFPSSNSNFGSSGSSFGSNFGSSGSSFGSDKSDPFSSDLFQSERKTSTTTDSARGIAHGFEKLGEAFGQAAGIATGVADKALTVTRNITGDNSITFTSGGNNAGQEPGKDVTPPPEEIHAHYNYKPPSSINLQGQTYPVFTGALPPYVVEYRTSGNKFSKLLAGLALYNLAKSPQNAYVSGSDEICVFGIRHKYKVNDEMKIDCQSISSFIMENQNQPPASDSGHSKFEDDPFFIARTKYYKDASFYGRPVQLEGDMECFISRTAKSVLTLKQNVNCDLLQNYSDQSLVNSAAMTKSTIVMLIMCLAYLIMF